MTKAPLQDAICAKTHDPIYTVHRYFARRPHNVIAHIIDHYLSDMPNSLIFDPFGGGGTTLIEGICGGHRVITSDTSGLAAFVMSEEASMAQINIEELEVHFKNVYSKALSKFIHLYECKGKEVYWLMRTTFTECPSCGSKAELRPETTIGNGNYRCVNCGTVFKPKNINVEQTEPSGICLMEKGSCEAGTPRNPEIAVSSRNDLIAYCGKVRDYLAQDDIKSLVAVSTPIPDCNLQRESALHKKGLLYFEQFIPELSRAVLNYMGGIIQETNMDDVQKRHLFFVLSASMRYCSRFSTINPGWRGRTKPLEWAKSNFWTPYTYVESNPFIGISDRWNSYKRAVQSAKRRMPQSSRKGSVLDVLDGSAQYSVLNQSSTSISVIPDESVDLIVTDPPYGSYLNYGELSAFWTSWLAKYLTDVSSVPDMRLEAVPARKKGYPGWKSFDDYQKLLSEVFSEAYRVLKPGSYCVVTFNNKEPEAWIAFLTAVKQAGFSLPENGVVFQDGVETYKRTIDSRRAGAIFGDFIYSFVKDGIPVVEDTFDWEREVKCSLDVLATKSHNVKYGDLFTTMYLSVLPKLYASINALSDSPAPRITMSQLQALIETRYARDGDRWILKPN